MSSSSSSSSSDCRLAGESKFSQSIEMRIKKKQKENTEESRNCNGPAISAHHPPPTNHHPPPTPSGLVPHPQPAAHRSVKKKRRETKRKNEREKERTKERKERKKPRRMNEERLGPLSHPGWYHYSSWAFKGFTEFLDFFISWFEPNGFASRTQSTKLGHPLRREQHHRHDLIEMRVSTVPVPVAVPKRESRPTERRNQIQRYGRNPATARVAAKKPWGEMGRGRWRLLRWQQVSTDLRAEKRLRPGRVSIAASQACSLTSKKIK